MDSKRICMLLAALMCCLCLYVGAGAVEIDCDSSYCFSSYDFSENELSGVCITGLPDSSAGTVKLGVRVIRVGDILTADQLDQLTFEPLLTESDTEATLTYLPVYENRVDRATTMTIRIRGKVNRAPVAEDSAMETYKNLPNTGMLRAYDPEGEELTYTILRQPRRGTVTINEDGSFTYTPKKNKVGTDSFVYTVTDPAGNVSRQATVTIQVLKPGDKMTYADTVGEECRFAAEWLRNTGVFTGEMIGGQLCFCPDQALTRGEFLTMLVQSLNLPIDEDAAYTGFADECPSWLRPYLAAALRSGLTAGWNGDSFDSDQPITGAEAALLLQNALQLPVTTAEDGTQADAIAVLAENGIVLSGDTVLTRADGAMALYNASKLSATAPGLAVMERA